MAKRDSASQDAVKAKVFAIAQKKAALALNRKNAADKKVAQAEAKEKVKILRKYKSTLKTVDLRKPLSPQRRAAINNLWIEYSELTSRAHSVVKPKSKKQLKVLQDFSGHYPSMGKFDVAFIPVAKGGKVKIKNDVVTIEYKHVTERILDFNHYDLNVDSAAEIRRILDSAPNATDFVIRAGRHTVPSTASRSGLEAKLNALMERYSAGGPGFGRGGRDNHWTNWLDGVKAIELRGQKAASADIDLYLKSNSEGRRKAKENRAKERSKIRRAKNKASKAKTKTKTKK